MPCFNEKLLDEEKNYQYIVPKKKKSHLNNGILTAIASGWYLLHFLQTEVTWSGYISKQGQA